MLTVIWTGQLKGFTTTLIAYTRTYDRQIDVGRYTGFPQRLASTFRTANDRRNKSSDTRHFSSKVNNVKLDPFHVLSSDLEDRIGIR